MGMERSNLTKLLDLPPREGNQDLIVDAAAQALFKDER